MIFFLPALIPLDASNYQKTLVCMIIALNWPQSDIPKENKNKQDHCDLDRLQTRGVCAVLTHCLAFFEPCIYPTLAYA